MPMTDVYVLLVEVFILGIFIGIYIGLAHKEPRDHEMPKL